MTRAGRNHHKARPTTQDAPGVAESEREELRARLRARCSKLRSNEEHSIARQMLTDPTSALLMLGVDDAATLRAAPAILQSATRIAKSGNLSRTVARH